MTHRKPLTVRLHDSDNVVVALRNIKVGTVIGEEKITSVEDIDLGHKVATSAIKTGDSIYKYGQIMGFASRDIQVGQHVHTHNVEMKDFERDYAIGADAAAEFEYESVRPPGRYRGNPR